MAGPDKRQVYCVLGIRSLPYAELCLASLLTNALEAIRLTLITDSDSDARTLRERMLLMPNAGGHSVTVYAKSAADGRSEVYFRAYSALAALRQGHPCWRKITDPLLFANPGEELILIDPDVYFPSPFSFEPTPPSGILLMYQAPNCLYPSEIVRRSYRRGVKMADHTDIGVCQFRMPLPLAVLEELVSSIGQDGLPRSMHIESIIWAALAERIGGGYLDPTAWHCFANTLRSRVRRRFGEAGANLLRDLDVGSMKAFHAGGLAKYWLADAEASGLLRSERRLSGATPVTAFVSYPRIKFELKMLRNAVARQVGLYKILGGGT